MKFNNINALIGVIYRPPDSSMTLFNDDLSKLLDRINNENKTCYLMGDFNVNFINYGVNNLVTECLNLFYSSSFLPQIFKPTRIASNSSTLIDNIFCNNHSISLTSGIVIADVSDHLPIYIKQNNIKPVSLMHNDNYIYKRDLSSKALVI